jgi:hypothetical protein
LKAQTRVIVGLLLLAFLVGSAQFQLLLIVFGDRVAAHAGAAHGVWEGLPHWRIYQGRIAGPFMAGYLHELTGWSFSTSYRTTLWILLVCFQAVFTLVSFSLYRRVALALCASLAAAFLSSFLMQGLWLYLWDLLDMIVFTLVVYFVLKRKPFVWLAALMLLETFNREAAVFIGGWLLLSAGVRYDASGSGFEQWRLEFDWRRAAACVALIVASLATTEWLRNTLLVREVGPEIFTDAIDHNGVFIWTGTRNLGWSLKTLSNPLSLRFSWIAVVFAVPVACLLLIRSRHPAWSRLSVLFGVLWLATFSFGVVIEPRVWLLFVPFLVLALVGRVGAEPEAEVHPAPA